jgi:ferrochelatase
VKRTAALAAGDREYYLSFQSRTGPVKWVGPNTIDESIRLAGMDKRGLFVVPVSFVCDHVETLHEIDIDLAEIVKEKTGVTLTRMPMFNGSEEFGRMLAQLVSERTRVSAG